MKKTTTAIWVECALMIAFATVLSEIKLVPMPYGGSVTAASMLPLILVSYRHGAKYGFTAGAAYAAVQLLLGLKNFSYVSSWQSVVALAVLDYAAAFLVLGLGGAFRRAVKDTRLSLCLGAILCGALRYVCHVISGATVWAGLSVPTEAALLYSVGYNASYMVPEVLILAATAYYLGGTFDWRAERPTRLTPQNRADFSRAVPIVGLAVLTAFVFDVSYLFAHLQGESGFSAVGLSSVNWWLFGGVNVAVALFAVLYPRLSRR